MEVSNIQEETTQENPAWSYARWFAVWLTLYLVLGAYAGLFSSGPRLPTGMTWENPGESWWSTFYILRDGPHLILQRNLHSQWLWPIILPMFAAVSLYAFFQGLHGKLKNKQGELLPAWGQSAMAMAMVGLMVLAVGFDGGVALKQQTLDLDPAADTVTLDGGYLCAFREVDGFRAYVTSGKGGPYYHISLQRAGQPPTELGGMNPHSDVKELASYLDGYLAEARRQLPGAQ